MDGPAAAPRLLERERPISEAALVSLALSARSDAWSRAPFPKPEALPSHCCGNDAGKRRRLEALLEAPGAALVSIRARQLHFFAMRRLRPRRTAAASALTRAAPPRRSGAGGRAGGGPADYIRCAQRAAAFPGACPKSPCRGLGALPRALRWPRRAVSWRRRRGTPPVARRGRARTRPGRRAACRARAARPWGASRAPGAPLAVRAPAGRSRAARRAPQ